MKKCSNLLIQTCSYLKSDFSKLVVLDLSFICTHLSSTYARNRLAFHLLDFNLLTSFVEYSTKIFICDIFSTDMYRNSTYYTIVQYMLRSPFCVQTLLRIATSCSFAFFPNSHFPNAVPEC